MRQGSRAASAAPARAWLAGVFLALGGLGLLSGCAGLPGPSAPSASERAPDAEPAEPEASVAEPRPTANPQSVSRAEFGSGWPFTVAEGTVSCEATPGGDPLTVFAAPGGSRYALNEVAGSEELGDIREVLDGRIRGFRAFALSLCELPAAP
ncbi:DUF2511 domain-containing protein [Leucobacter sp. M11]|nr:DUF2511 domain-containing protein [Leucobacter sp. M11]